MQHPRKIWASALLALAVAACSDLPTTPESKRSPADLFGGAKPSPVQLGAEDTITYAFGDGRRTMDVRHNSTQLARGVGLDWKIGDPATPPKGASFQNYWEASGDEPNYGAPSQPQVPSQAQTCYERAKYNPTYKFSRDAEQTLRWTDTNQRQPRLELVRARFTAWFGGFWSINAPGVPDYACVVLDSVRVIREAYEYNHLTSVPGQFLWNAAFDFCSETISGAGCAPLGYAWPEIYVEAWGYFGRYCNYYQPNQYIMYTLFGTDYWALDWPEWEIRATPMGTEIDETHWGGYDSALNLTGYGWPSSVQICSFSDNNYDQRAGLAHWVITKDVQAVP